MKQNGIRIFLGAAITCLAVGILSMFLGARLVPESATEPTLPLPVLISATIGMYGFLLISVFLWVNECFLRWNELKIEGKDVVDRLLSIGWLILTNIYGAYFYSIRRALGKEVSNQTPETNTG